MKNNFFYALATILLVGCASQYPELENGLYADIETNKGSIVVSLELEKTPITVANFVSLSEGENDLVSDNYKNKRYYDGLVFHRVIKDFMIQGGDPTASGSGNPGYKFNDEINAVNSGKIDILCTPTPPTLARRSQVSYSVPVYTAGLSAVVREDASQPLLNVLNGKVAHTGPTWRATANLGLSNQTYAAIAGGVTEAWIHQQMRLLGVVATLVTVENADAGLKQVADGKASAFFAERMVLKHLLSRNDPAGHLVLLERIFEYAPTAMALDRNDEDFRLLVDTALSEMYRAGDIEQAYDKYLDGAGEAAKKLFKIYALP